MALRVHVTHPYSRVSITLALRKAGLQAERGDRRISYSSGPNPLQHALKSDPPLGLNHEVGVFVANALEV